MYRKWYIEHQQLQGMRLWYVLFMFMQCIYMYVVLEAGGCVQVQWHCSVHRFRRAVYNTLYVFCAASCCCLSFKANFNCDDAICDCIFLMSQAPIHTIITSYLYSRTIIWMDLLAVQNLPFRLYLYTCNYVNFIQLCISTCIYVCLYMYNALIEQFKHYIDIVLLHVHVQISGIYLLSCINHGYTSTCIDLHANCVESSPGFQPIQKCSVFQHSQKTTEQLGGLLRGIVVCGPTLTLHLTQRACI